ncbi:MAG: hypothetical protein KAT71_04960, partial [Gammaproteobacteria bacterium]|nr:hypothetical protein [Gammaproteobacteria bacterium]
MMPPEEQAGAPLDFTFQEQARISAEINLKLAKLKALTAREAEAKTQMAKQQRLLREQGPQKGMRRVQKRSAAIQAPVVVEGMEKDELMKDIVRQAKALSDSYANFYSKEFSLDETDQEMQLLASEKDALFLLVNCFGLLFPFRYANLLGPNIQNLLIHIYESANEGKHYLAQDVIFKTYSKILLQTNLFATQIAIDIGHTTDEMPKKVRAWISGTPSPIRKITKRYFRDKYSRMIGHEVANVECEPKKRGRQLGTTAIVTFKDG